MSKKDDLEPLFGLVDSLNKHKNKQLNKPDPTAPMTPYQAIQPGSVPTKLILRSILVVALIGVVALIWGITQIKPPVVAPISNKSQPAPSVQSVSASGTSFTTLSTPTTQPRRSQGFAGRVMAPTQTVPPHMQVRDDSNDEQREREQREREYDGTQGYEPPPAQPPYDPNVNNAPNDNNISN